MLEHFSRMGLPTENDWIVPGIVPYNGLVVLASAPKSGKSMLANAIARAMCSGGTFGGDQYHDRYAVAWCAHEETPDERGPLLVGLDSDAPYYISMGPQLPFLDDPACTFGTDRFGRLKPGRIPYVYQEAAEKKVQLLVIDSLYGAVRNSDLADNQVARRLMNNLRHWSTQFGIATLVLHHLTKSAHRGYHPERFADSAQILAAASCHFFLESARLDDGRWRVVLHGAGRQPSPPPRQEFIADSFFNYERVEIKPEQHRPTTADRIRELMENGWELTAEEIANRLDVNPKTVRNILSTLDGVTRLPGPRTRIKYGLA